MGEAGPLPMKSRTPALTAPRSCSRDCAAPPGLMSWKSSAMSWRAVAVSASARACVRFCSIARRRSACEEPCPAATAVAAISNAAAAARRIANARLPFASRPFGWLFTTSLPWSVADRRRIDRVSRVRQSPRRGILAALARRYGRTVVTARQRGRARERLELLGESSLDCESLQREAIAELRAVIGFDRWCWPLSDPEA